MEGVVSGRKMYWKKRNGYQRLDGYGWGFGRKKKVERVTLGSTTQRKKRFRWKIKIKPKLKLFKFSSPKKLLTSIRDGYVKMMLGLANSRVFASGGVGGFAYGGGAIDSGFRSAPLKEYDEKMIIEIYKSLMIKGQLVPRDALKTSEAVVSSV
ncbi:hypothetical protein FRX31_024497 [Thalictrum thalictroides]|uniref:Uncharacterized protein n=1 Tax=Thalictrum thalictroides TaxID=46969 RepID=A0A7J6VLA0_THATH|nr:hypothetical protein FRX31_024497 [Thalictrum thalictroides]